MIATPDASASGCWPHHLAVAFVTLVVVCACGRLIRADPGNQRILLAWLDNSVLTRVGTSANFAAASVMAGHKKKVQRVPIFLAILHETLVYVVGGRDETAEKGTAVRCLVLLAWLPGRYNG